MGIVADFECEGTIPSITIKKGTQWVPFLFMAVGVGFEPTEDLSSTVFKTAAFDRSASPPETFCLPHAEQARIIQSCNSGTRAISTCAAICPYSALCGFRDGFLTVGYGSAGVVAGADNSSRTASHCRCLLTREQHRVSGLDSDLSHWRGGNPWIVDSSAAVNES